MRGESMLHRLLETGEVCWLNTDKLFSKFKLPTITPIDCPMTYVSPVHAGIYRRLVSRQMSRRTGDSNLKAHRYAGISTPHSKTFQKQMQAVQAHRIWDQHFTYSVPNPETRRPAAGHPAVYAVSSAVSSSPAAI